LLVKLATEAADNEEACAFIEMMVKEMKKKVRNIKKSSSVALNKEAQLSLLDNTEIANHIQSVEKLFETVKGIKKNEGQNSGKRLKGWVERQTKKTKKFAATNNIEKNLLR
jgi:hypothetical protein